VLESTGEQVVVKLERIAGSLASEQQGTDLADRQAMSGAASAHRIRGDVQGERVFCLVTGIARLGHAPKDRSGWFRDGALDRDAGWDRLGKASGFLSMDVVNRSEQAHTQRIDDLADDLKNSETPCGNGSN